MSRIVVALLTVAGLASPTPAPAHRAGPTSTTTSSTTTSTSTTSTTTVTTARKPLDPMSQSDVARQLREAWPEDPDRAVAVGRCESTLRPAAENGQHRGIMQIAVKVHADRIAAMGYTPAQMFEVAPNLAVARALYDESKWGPWRSSRHCWAAA